MNLRIRTRALHPFTLRPASTPAPAAVRAPAVPATRKAAPPKLTAEQLERARQHRRDEIGFYMGFSSACGLAATLGALALGGPWLPFAISSAALFAGACKLVSPYAGD